jgi:hypothetical protein
MYKKTYLSLILAVCFSFETGFAQWTSDSTVNTPVCNAVNDQRVPEIVSDGAGGAIIVWQDERDGYGISKIYAQRIDSSGIARWMPNGIVICTADKSMFPKLTSDGVGGAIITWFDNRTTEILNSSYVCAQRVNGNGDTLWEANGVVLSNSASSWSYPVITGYGSNGAIVAWDGMSGEIYAQKIDTSGIVQWPAGGVLLAPRGGDLQIIGDNSGGAIVAFTTYNPEFILHIFAQRVDSTGAVKWSPNGYAICVTPEWQFKPDQVFDGNGSTIIAWQDRRFSPYQNIYAQKVDTGGVSRWAEYGNKISIDQGVGPTRIASDGTGGAFLVWVGGGGVCDNVVVQHIDGNGVLQWPNEIQISFIGNVSQERICSDGAGGVYIIWTSYVTSYIRAQHIAPNGILSFPVGGKTVSISGGGVPVLVADERGGAIIAWEDCRSPSSKDIYAQRIIMPGFTTGVLRGGQSETTPREFALNQNYPNPFNPTTTISFTLAEDGLVTLKVYDLLGREVAMLVNQDLKAGALHNVTFDASRLSTGIYIYRLQAGNNVQVKKLMLIK